MNKSAILHIPMSQYAYGTDEEHVVIRLRAARDDIKECKLFYGDRSCRHTPVYFTEIAMKITASSSLHDYFEVELEKPYKRLCYYFQLSDGKETTLYYGDQFQNDPVDDRSEYFQLPFNHRADIVNPPEWARHAIFYNIFPDSFATRKEYLKGSGLELVYKSEETGIENMVKGKLGGTIRGITENVEYLRELGINAIYINPIFTAGEYHKYDLLDYFHIDPCFGSNEDFKKLVETYHANGIRVVIDGVFNHCGWKFFAFEDVVEKGEKSPYKDWFYGLQYPVVRPEDPETYPNYDCFGYERMMPKLNLDNAEAAEYFCEVGRYWIRKFDIDGWRLDVASEINDGFWRKFHKAVKEEKQDAILIGEVWESAAHWLDGTIFDSTMNYDFRRHCKRFFGEESIDAYEFSSRVTDMLMRYRRQTLYAQLNVLDTHDVSRFLSLCQDNKEKLRLAVLFQMTFPGMPCIFYGDELGIAGVEECDYRKPMPWEKKQELSNSFYKAFIELRKAHQALQTGKFQIVSAEKESGLLIYRRMDETEILEMVINMGEKVKIEKLGQIIVSEKLAGNELEKYGYIVSKI